LIDYDVVIIGGTPAGRYGALIATQLRATVALVEPQPGYGFLKHHAISQAAQGSQLKDNHPFPWENTRSGIDVDKDAHLLADMMLFANGIVDHVEEQHSPTILAAKGVDIIYGNGQFQPSPHLAFAVNERLLRARNYVIATGSHGEIPEVMGLLATGFLAPNNIWQFIDENTLPKHWAIMGGTPQSIEIAQALRYLGCQVTLIVPYAHILPCLDLDIAFLLQAELEAEGICVLTATQVTQVQYIDGQKWLQVGNRAIASDEILVATPGKPHIESLNLPAVGVKWRSNRLLVNHKLQTTNRRIYACGEVIGGFACGNIANYEARIAIKNALFFSRLEVNYRSLPWAVLTNPMVAQVGLTESVVEKQYKQDQFIVLRQSFKTLATAQIQDVTTGICKLIVLHNGEILGASIFGSQAGELINIIALAMAQRIKVNHLANLFPIYPSFSQILQETSVLWEQQKFNHNIGWQEFLEDFFQFRRNWQV